MIPNDPPGLKTTRPTGQFATSNHQEPPLDRSSTHQQELTQKRKVKTKNADG